MSRISRSSSTYPNNSYSLHLVAEDVIGEYVLNISKENIKIAAHRGKIKLENVQLDGDLIGSHVLGAAGLSGFGVLSCWAKSRSASPPRDGSATSPTPKDCLPKPTPSTLNSSVDLPKKSRYRFRLSLIQPRKSSAR